MEKLEAVSSGLSAVYKLWIYIKNFFQKNNRILYINENKKILDLWQIERRQSLKGYQIVLARDNSKLGYKNVKIHFLRMKKSLFLILGNLTEGPSLLYSGFASTPFAAFDGYCLGDNENITFYDNDKTTNEEYAIVFKKKARLAKNIFPIKNGEKEVSLLLSCSYPITPECCKTNVPQFAFNHISEDEITSDYLNEVFYFVSDFLDECREKSVQLVNLYLSSRQPVSFVAGTAIQSHHPHVHAYEFENGKYTWAVDIQDAKLIFPKEKK